jgi:hypothetical protein
MSNDEFVDEIKKAANKMADDIIENVADKMITDLSLPKGTIIMETYNPRKEEAEKLFDIYYPIGCPDFNGVYRGTVKRWWVKGYLHREVVDNVKEVVVGDT